MIIPRVEHSPGTQSLMVMRTGMGSYGPGSGSGSACFEAMVESRKNHHPNANCLRLETGISLQDRRGRAGGAVTGHAAHQSAGKVD